MQGEFNAELQTCQLALEENNEPIRAEALGVIGAADRRYKETVEIAEVRHKQIVEETRTRDEAAKTAMQQAFAQRERELKTEISDARRAEIRTRHERSEAEVARDREARTAANLQKDLEYTTREKKHPEERLADVKRETSEEYATF